MPMTSSSVSVGRPSMKYSFTALQPPSKAVRQDCNRSSSFTFLLMVSRIRWVPASGAKVMLVLRTRWRRCMMLMENPSARREGRLMLMLRGSQYSSRPSHSSVRGR